jgi:hypothetical protein
MDVDEASSARERDTRHLHWVWCGETGAIMKRSVTVVVIASALLVSMGGVSGADATTDPDETIRIEAYVDGRSQLIMRGATAQWHHFDYAAPGRWRFADEPTLINDVEWYPSWPDQPDTENRDCNCYSDVFTEVRPPIPSVPFDVDLRLIESRFETTVVEHPSAANDFTLIIEFNDNRPAEPAWYVVEFVVPTPEGSISDLQEDVQHLVDDGVLKKGLGKALLAKLDQAQRKLSHSKFEQACKQLEKFVVRVEGHERKGRLGSADAASLTEKAGAAMTMICGR